MSKGNSSGGSSGSKGGSGGAGGKGQSSGGKGQGTGGKGSTPSNPNWPSTTGKESGGGRGNNAPSK